MTSASNGVAHVTPMAPSRSCCAATRVDLSVATLKRLQLETDLAKADLDLSLVRQRIEGIPVRLEQIWAEAKASGRDPAAVADAMAQRLIGRA